MERKSYLLLVISLIFYIISAIFIASTSAIYGNVCESSEYGYSSANYDEYTYKSIIILLVIGVVVFIISYVILRFADIANKQKSFVIVAYIILFVMICIYTATTSYDTAYKLHMNTPIGNRCNVEIIGNSFIKL